MVTVTKDERTEATRVGKKQQAIYWSGALPAIGKATILVSAKENNPRFRDFVEEKSVTAAEMWQPLDTDTPQQWVGKCKQEMGIPLCDIAIHRHVFRAYSTRPETHGDGNAAELIYPKWPGGICVYTEDQAEEVIRLSNKHFLRRGPNSQPQWEDAGAAIGRQNPSDPQTIPHPPDLPSFDESLGDRWVSEFVYFVKVRDLKPGESKARIMGDPSLPASHSPLTEQYAVAPVKTFEDFFSTPPASIADMYARK